AQPRPPAGRKGTLMSPPPAPELVLTAAVPLGQQLRDLIVLGLLRPGDEMPTVRETAVALALNPQAVQRAYAELTRDGLLSAEDGRGPYVAAPLPAGRPGDAAAALERLCLDFLARAANYGFTEADVAQTFQALAHRRPPT